MYYWSSKRRFYLALLLGCLPMCLLCRSGRGKATNNAAKQGIQKSIFCILLSRDYGYGRCNTKSRTPMYNTRYCTNFSLHIPKKKTYQHLSCILAIFLHVEAYVHAGYPGLVPRFGWSLLRVRLTSHTMCKPG